MQADRGARLEFLDGLRGVAAALVVACHLPAFTPTPAAVMALGLANAWVAIFITLSGFCLYLPAAQRTTVGLPRPFPEFMLRRARRILPPWYASLALCVLVGVFFAAVGYVQPVQFIPSNWLDLTTHLTLVHSMTRYSGTMNGPGYTLGTEWQLYLLMLPLLYLVRRLGWAALILLVAALALPIPDYAGKLVHKVIDPTFAFPFVIGMASARVFYQRFQSHPPKERSHSSSQRTLMLLGTVSAVFAIATLVLLHNQLMLLGSWSTAIATGAACILMGLRPASFGARILSSRAGKTLGGFSYSLYLTHFPLLALAGYAVYALGVDADSAFYVVYMPALPLIFGFAYLFSLAFERPFMRPLNVRSTIQQSIPAPFATTIPTP